MAAVAAPSTPRERWRARIRYDLPWLIPLVAITLWYFRPLLASTGVIYGGLDITRQFYVFKHAAVAELHAGRLPLWLPSLYCGMPLLGALIDTPFHPWDLCAALAGLSLPVTFNVGLLLHLLAGQLGAYSWVRQGTIRRLPAALAACWIWNPFVLNAIASGDHNNVRAMLLAPAILAALERGLDYPRVTRAWLVYGGLQALQILCSGLQFAFYTCVIGGLTAAGSLWGGRGREEPRLHASRIRWWLLATMFALALPMAQLLPGLEFGQRSVRGEPDIVWSSVWGIPPGLLLSYVAPFVYRGTELLLYWGIVPLWLAGVGMLEWRHPRRLWYVAVLAAALVLCIGADWPASAWLNGLPVLRGFRGPFRIALFANLMLARLAAGGLAVTMDAIRDQALLQRWRSAAFRSGVGVVLLGIGALIWWPQSRFFTTWTEAHQSLLLWLATAGLVATCYFSPGRWALGGFAVLATLDWSLAVRPLWHATSLDPFRADATVERLQHALDGNRIWLRGTPSANYMALFDIPSAAGHHAFPLRRTARFTQALELDLRGNDDRLLRLTQTQFILTYNQPFHDAPVPPIRSYREVEVEEVRHLDVPKYRIMAPARWLPSGAAVWDVMRSRDWDPVLSPVLLEGSGGRERPETRGLGGTVTVQSHTPTRAMFRVQADGPGYLVIAETWYPGWRATVNGKSARVHRANYKFQAVPVPSGVSTVLLRFAPTSVRIGLFTSSVALVAFLAIFGVTRGRDSGRV